MNFKNIRLNYTITNNLLRLLTKISAAKETIDNAYILPQWEVKLRREAVITDSHHSTRIEGNTLTLEEVSELAQGREIMTTRKEKDEALNYLTVLGNIEQYSKQRLTHSLILRLHKSLTKETLESDKYCGQFRKEQVVVGKKLGSKLVVSFTPPKPTEVSNLVSHFFKWLVDETKDLEPIIVAGITHYEIARIHPFTDGNGRTARVMASLMLHKLNFDINRFFALDDYYDLDRKAYYKALQTVHPKALDITEWLEYFTKGVEQSVARVRDKVLELSKEKRAASLSGKVYLSKNQQKILAFLEKKGPSRTSEIAKHLKVSRQSANKDISKLLLLELVEKSGSGPQIRYSRKL